MKLVIIVVAFNKSVSESKSLLSLISQKNINKNLCIDLHVYDNSPVKKIDVNDLVNSNHNFNVDCVWDGRNKTLREIYSDVISSCNSSVDYFLFLDDDSELNRSYISNFHSTYINEICGCNLSHRPVIIPKIVFNGSVYSPYKPFIFTSRPYEGSFGFVEGLHAINSGIFVPNSPIIRKFAYPDYADFYGTDTVLFEFLNQKEYPVYYIDSEIDHDISFSIVNGFDVYIPRLKLVVKFWRSHYNKPHTRMILELYILILSIKLSIKFRKIVYL
ncbi:hypothetical protein [Vibrio splendidus]|uniref:hypothetical protein n=1 Tax=Vibrio splendidus TaxID=29497 RepID=UPI000D3D1EED|nr:hypothetical protein [Vibrio splendidus]PTO68216.1 hypothetical protein CWN81_20530 [Vibrio splendidus]PTP81870.1 hypothetical protein CWO03_22745 [Vibrio splendidus]